MLRHSFKRLISLGLSLVLSASLLASCGTEGGDGPDTHPGTGEGRGTEAFSEAETAVDRAHTPDSLPSDLDFGEASVSFARCDKSLAKQEIDPADDGDPVNAAVHERNIAVEDRLNVRFEVSSLGDEEQIVYALSRSITSGSDDYDVVPEHQWKLLPQTLEHLFIDLWGNEYIDPDQPWW